MSIILHRKQMDIIDVDGNPHSVDVMMDKSTEERLEDVQGRISEIVSQETAILDEKIQEIEAASEEIKEASTTTSLLIERKTRDALASIPDNYQELNAKVNKPVVVDESPDPYTKLSIELSLSDEIDLAEMKDVDAVNNTLSILAERGYIPNLNIPKFDNKDHITDMGLTYTNNDGHIILTGTPTGYRSFLVCRIPGPKKPFTVSMHGKYDNVTTEVLFYGEPNQRVHPEVPSTITYVDPSLYPDMKSVVIAVKRLANISTNADFYVNVDYGDGVTLTSRELTEYAGKLIENAFVQNGERISSTNKPFASFNDAPANTICTITTLLDNAPTSDGMGTLMTVNGAKSFGGGTLQIFSSWNNHIYTRMAWGNPLTWYGWNELSNSDASNLYDALKTNAVVQNGARISAANKPFNNFNDAPTNTIYTFTTLLDNAPTADGLGTLLTFNGDKNYLGGTTQIFMSSSTNRLYSRFYWGSAASGAWSSWRECAVTEQTVTKMETYADIAMFEKFGVIGDSFASGVIYTGVEASDRRHYELSWGQILARKSGNTCNNYSTGGEHTRSFLANQETGMPKLLSDISDGNICGLYILCLGINDSNSDKTGGLSYLGNINDIKSNWRNNADSFYGNYGKIIAQIKESCPNSKIVMTTFCRIPTDLTKDGYIPFNDAIKNIASHFGIPCINLTDDEFFNSSYYLNRMVGSHPTAQQYSGYANAINRLFAKTVINNDAYFRNYIGV